MCEKQCETNELLKWAQSTVHGRLNNCIIIINCCHKFHDKRTKMIMCYDYEYRQNNNLVDKVLRASS